MSVLADAADGVLLTVPAEKEEQLRLKRIGPNISIEMMEERVFFHHLEHCRRLERLGQQPGQRRLADTDGPLDADAHTFSRSPARQEEPLPGPRRPVHHAGTRHAPDTFWTSWSRTSARNEASRRPSGNAASGAISSRGSSTKRRRIISGCGIVSTGVPISISSYKRISMSTVRGPHPVVAHRPRPPP